MNYDTIFEVMLKLGPRDLQNACRVDRIHSDVCDDNNFWVQKIKRDYPKIEGHYDYQQAKKTWILCTVGHRFEFDICLNVELYYLGREEGKEQTLIEDKNPENLVGNEMTRIPKDLETENFILEQVGNLRQILRESRNVKDIKISKYIISYIERSPRGDRLILYIRKSKSNIGIPRFDPREISMMEYAIADKLFSKTEDLRDDIFYYNDQGERVENRRNENLYITVLERKRFVVCEDHQIPKSLEMLRKRLMPETLNNILFW